MPIAISTQEREKLGALARRIDRSNDWQQLGKADQDAAMDHTWLFEISDGIVVPNALARFLGMTGRNVLLSPEAMEKLNATHQAATIRAQLRKLPAMIEEKHRDSTAYANVLDHERDFQNLNKAENKPSFHIWKCSKTLYLVWREREDDGAILINRIWADCHQAYERSAETASPTNSQGLFDDPATIQWTTLPDDEEQGNAVEQPHHVRKVKPSHGGEIAELKRIIKTERKRAQEAFTNCSAMRKQRDKAVQECNELIHQNQMLRQQIGQTKDQPK